MKILPNDIEAEQAILGACLIDLNSVSKANEILQKDDFYREDNKIIFGCISSMYTRNIPIDIITLKSELELIGKLDNVGGMEYIASLPDKVLTTANIENYIDIVKNKAMKRYLIEMSNDISTKSFDTTVETDDLTEYAQRRIFEITQKKDTKRASCMKDLVAESLNKLEDVINHRGKKGIPTGFFDVDKRMGGLKGSELIILAARPGMGKSALALNIATNVATKSDIPVLVFNLEMNKLQLTDRLICSKCLIDARKYRDGKLEDNDWPKLASGVSELSKAKIFIDDNDFLTISDIRTRCREMHMKEHIGLIIIDYLQLITPSQGKNSREQEVAEISRTLKLIAKELDVPIIALSQLSRENVKRKNKDKRPVLSDLRDSGSIEQDADVVLFIHREGYYEKNVENPNDAEIIFAKFRAGEPGTEHLLWMGPYTKFENMQM